MCVPIWLSLILSVTYVSDNVAHQLLYYADLILVVFPVHIKWLMLRIFSPSSVIMELEW